MKKKQRVVLESLLIGILTFVLTVTAFLNSWDYMLRDAFYQTPGVINTDIQIIAIDDKTIDALGPYGTWSRSYYADLLHILNDSEYQPSIVAFDILFSGEMDAKGDEAFAEACVESNNIITVSQVLYQTTFEQAGQTTVKNDFSIMDISQPYDAIEPYVLTGYGNIAPDSDGVVRRIRFEQDEKDLYSFSERIYRSYCEKNGIIPNEVQTDHYQQAMIGYSGRSGEYEAVSLIDVLDGTIDPRCFQDNIVLVGAYAQGLQDSFQVPNSHGNQMYGVEIHANLIQCFINNGFAVQVDPLFCGLISGLIAAILFILYRNLKPVWGVVIVVTAIALNVFIGITLKKNGFVIPLLYFPFVTLLAYGYCLILHYYTEWSQKKRVLSAFKKYVAPEVVAQVAKQGNFQLKLSGENRDIAVLFVDIRGFTTMSEAMEPEQVVEILNSYLDLITKAVFQNGGTLDKFIGDAAMAVFNSPFEMEDYVYHAVSAALDIVAGGDALAKALMERFGRTIGFGVGVNCGPAVIGNIGCEFRMDYTAIGDTVNTAARLEANAKKSQVLISEEVYKRLENRLEVNAIGEIPLKGKTQGVFVYEVLNKKGEENG